MTRYRIDAFCFDPRNDFSFFVDYGDDETAKHQWKEDMRVEVERRAGSSSVPQAARVSYAFIRKSDKSRGEKMGRLVARG